MWPPGHVAAGYLLYALSTRARSDDHPEPGPTLVVAFGALVPDLVDKPLAWGVGLLPMGRTLAHSLLVLVPLCLSVGLLTRYRGEDEYGIAFAVGALLHAALDAVPILWNPATRVGYLLWPYSSVNPYEGGAPTVLDLLTSSLGDPYVLVELLLILLASGLWYKHDCPGWPPKS